MSNACSRRLFLARVSLQSAPHRPCLTEAVSGKYSQGYLEVEVLVEEEEPVADAMPGARAKARVSRRRRRHSRSLVGAIVSNYDGATAQRLYSEEEMESGLALVQGPGQDEALLRLEGDATNETPKSHVYEVSCDLIDSATGHRYALSPARTLEDWQLGSAPGSAPRGEGICRSSRSRRARSTRSCARGWRVKDTVGVHSPEIETSARLFRLQVPGEVRAWSAEDPQLYTVVIGLKVLATGPPREDSSRSFSAAGHGGYTQFESARVGFRTVVVRSGQLLVNGRAVMLAGVNRHEHDPETGKTVSGASMRRDIVTMKRCGRSLRYGECGRLVRTGRWSWS